MSGFELAYTLHGGDAHKLTLPIKSGEAVKAGTLVQLDDGEAAVAAAAATDNLGVCTGIDANGNAVVVVDPQAVYRVTDSTARALGATLDIAAGARGVAASSEATLIVAGLSPAGAKTLVKIAGAHHALVG